LVTSPPSVTRTPFPDDDVTVPWLDRVQKYPAVPTIASPLVTDTKPADATVNGFWLA
jgi:hypothetical protein